MDDYVSWIIKPISNTAQGFLFTRNMVKVNENGDKNHLPPDSIVSNDDESFVVLGRSPSQPASLVNSSLGYMSNVSGIGVQPNGHGHGQSMGYVSTLSDFNLEEIQQRLDSVLQENYQLKETLHQNNLAMKQQFATLVTWQEQVAKVHETHKTKFTETKELVLQLRDENKELKEIIEKLKCKDTGGPSPLELQLKAEIKHLKVMVEELQRKLSQAPSNEAVSRKEQELQALYEQVNHRLEVAERARRQQDIEIERLVAQRSRYEQELNSSKAELAAYKQNLLSLENEKHVLQRKLQELTDENSRLVAVSADVAEKQKTPQNDGSENFKELEDKYYRLHSDYETLQQELLTFQKDQAIKETHNNNYFKVQAEGFTDKINELKAKIVEKDDAISQRDKQLVKLKDTLKKVALENEEIAILKAQVEVYQSDFNAEREARERLVGERDRLLEDVKSLQRQNQQLLDEMEVYQNNHYQQAQQQQQQQQQQHSTNNKPASFGITSSGWSTIAAPGRGHTSNKPAEVDKQEETEDLPPPVDDYIPPPQKFYCPKCELVFQKFDLLQYHVETCLELS